MKRFAILLAEFFRHAYFKLSVLGSAYFRAMLIFKKRTYYRENTVLHCYEVLWIHNIDAICRFIQLP